MINSVKDDPFGAFQQPDDRGAQVEELIKRVHGDMVAMRDRWVAHRSMSGVESRWRKAKILYDGSQAEMESAFVESLRNGPARRVPSQQRSKLVVNIVRPKVDQAVARMCEILLPTDGKNWGLKPTPIPDAVSQMVGDYRPTVIPGTQTPTGLTGHQEASAYMTAAREAGEGMERAIDDKLTEGSFNAESRKVIENGCRLGTGILFGPTPSVQYASKWTHVDGHFQKMRSKKIVPRSFSEDPWDVWFDPACGNKHQRGQGVWKLKRATRKEIRALAGQPGFSDDMVRKTLQTAPSRVTVAEGRVTRTFTTEETYELWTYHGAVEPDQMTLVSLGNNGDPLEDVEFGVIVMCQDLIIGAMPSWVEDQTLPVDVWCWRESDDSPYGHGVPGDMEHQQAAVIAAWRQVMDNSKVSSGGQVVVGKGITPANGSMEITPNKVWHADGDIVDVNKAFALFQMSAHLQDLMSIATTAMTLADQETSMPQMLGGEKGGQAPETLGGMVMLFSNASAVLRYRCKRYDDNITSPHITRYFDWEMQYGEDDSIKGDMEIVAIGASALLERDIQNQGALNMVSVTSNERYAHLVDPKKELKIILKAMKQKPEDLMFTDEEITQNEQKQQEAGPPQDPQVVRAQSLMQAKQMDIEDREKQRQFDGQRMAEDAALKRETLNYNQQREQEESNLANTQMSIERDTTLLKLNQEATLTREATAARDRLETLKISNSRQIFQAELDVKQRQGSGI